MIDGREEIGWISHDQTERWIFSPDTLQFMGVDCLWHVDYLRGSYPPPPGLKEVPNVLDADGNEVDFTHPDCIFYPINTEQKNICCMTVWTTASGKDVSWVFDMSDTPRFEPYNSEKTIEVYSWNQ